MKRKALSLTLALAVLLSAVADAQILGLASLSGLPYGKHNVTVFGWDFAGNSGASETIYFNVANSFPSLPVTVASVIVVAVVCAALLVKYKKYKTKAKAV